MSRFFMLTAAFLFTFSIYGCGDSGPAVVEQPQMSQADQAAADAAYEAEMEADSAAQSNPDNG